MTAIDRYPRGRRPSPAQLARQHEQELACVDQELELALHKVRMLGELGRYTNRELLLCEVMAESAERIAPQGAALYQGITAVAAVEMQRIIQEAARR